MLRSRTGCRHAAPVPVGLVLLLAVVGCTGLDRAERSQFYQTSPFEFEYRTTTDFFRDPAPVSWAESERLNWLDAFLDRYAMCPSGYELVSRRAVVRYQAPLGYPVDDIVYRGRCRV
jgi:hypothetical protein